MYRLQHIDRGDDTLDLVILVDHHQRADPVDQEMRHHVNQLVIFMDGDDSRTFVTKNVSGFHCLTPLCTHVLGMDQQGPA